MRSPPEEFDPDALVEFLAEGWAFDVEAAEYVAVGAGSYHWAVRDREGRRGFVTVDDLDRKPWLGDTRESAFDGLRRAFDTAVALRDSGLAFVVAPIPTSRGETVRRIGPRYSGALFPFVEGQVGKFGHPEASERAAVTTMLAELHRATPVVGSVAPTMDLGLPGRDSLESALREVNQPWSSGPFAERARDALARHADDVAELLSLADRLSVDVAEDSNSWVVTHGEPHAANVMRATGTRLLIDWDTVAIGPPERDLWMLVDGTGAVAAAYFEATGHRLDPGAVDFFRLTWDLKDLASYLDMLRSPHDHTADTAIACRAVTLCVAIRDQWAQLLDRP